MLVAVFAAIAVSVQNGAAIPIENDIYGAIAAHISPPLTGIMIIVTNLGSVYAVVGVVLLLTLIPRLRAIFGLQPIATLTVSPVLNSLLKSAFARERPYSLMLIQEQGYAFPSGHAMNNAALYAMITLVVFRHTKNAKARTAAVVISLLMAFAISVSRLYLGVHCASDVAAGWALGVAVALLFDTIWTRKDLINNIK